MKTKIRTIKGAILHRLLLLVFTSILVMLFACKEEILIENPLTHVLSSEHPLIKGVIDSLEQYELQIKYTQIDRENDSVIFKDFEFQVDSLNYFYPASTVKFPTAMLALERLNQIDSLNMHTRFYIEGDSVETTFAKAISEIFAVSDNNANNRLVEFLGQDAINARLQSKGIGPARIAHRLGYHTDDLETKPLIIYLNDSTTSTLSGTVNSEAQALKINKVQKGIGFYADGVLIEEPFDFAFKNHYPISSQHELMKRTIFPEKFKPHQRFAINDAQRAFLLSAMHSAPRTVGYDPIDYYDGYCKFFMYGDTKEAIPSNIKIYNKVGFAYGTLTDCAYIIDEKNQVEFMLTATILVNKDGVFNDDNYEYDSIGIPFLAELGRQFYAYELGRKN